jgi:NPCBM/NEW2 domain-containing protein
MRLLSFCFFVFIALSVCGGEKIALSEVQWTDAASSWTWDGKKLPVKDKNLFGKEISIGGVKYKKGLAGHTGFSIVYNLSAQALRFTALAGIDDQAHSRDPKNITESSAIIIVLVDRKEVFRKVVELGEKAIPIDIDLKGKYQLEIRGKYGSKGFHKQRVTFANPVIEVINKKAFLRNAEEWHNKVEKEKNVSVIYPPAPKWDGIKIEKITYQNWENAYRINNGKCELIIVPEFGGRILSFSLLNGKNILSKNGKFKKSDIIKRGFGFTDGGHFTRPQPRNYFMPCDPILLFGKYNIEFPAEGEIIVTSQKSWYLWLQYQYKIKVSKDKPIITITNIHKSIAPFQNSVGIWSITRVNTSMAQAILMPPEISTPPQPFSFTPENLFPKVKKLPTGWQELSFSKEFIQKFGPRDSVQWQEYPKEDVIKIIFDNCIFTKKFELSKEDLRDMDGFYPAHIYLCKKFLEVEAHGPTRKLVLSSIASLRESWTLERTDRHFDSSP